MYCRNTRTLIRDIGAVLLGVCALLHDRCTASALCCSLPKICRSSSCSGGPVG